MFLLTTLSLTFKYWLLHNLLLLYCTLFSELPFGSLGIWSHCNFACFTDIAISSFFFKPWLKLTVYTAYTAFGGSRDIFYNSPWSAIDVHILTQDLQSPKPKISTYFHRRNFKCINKLCDMRTPHLHSLTCSGSKITTLTLLSQLIPCKEPVKTVYYKKYSLPVSRAELLEHDCHVVVIKYD